MTYSNPIRCRLKQVCSIVLFVLLLASITSGSGWYQENVPVGQEITMMDLRWPFWPKGTYFAFWNGKLAPRGGTFYGGLVSGASEPDYEGEHHPNLIWSFWPNDAYGGDVVRSTYVHPTAYSVQYGGEGMSGGLSSSDGLEWMEPGNWYRMLMRVWQPAGETDKGNIGWWVKDIAHDKWRLLGTFSVPCNVSELRGNCGFVELLGGHESPRVLERRLSYARVDGEWVKSNSMTVKADKSHTWHASLTEDGSVARFVHSKDPQMKHNVEPGESKTITTEQPADPPLDKPTIEEVAASIYGDQILVEWGLTENSSPQLGYRIEFFSEADAKGRLIAEERAMVPHVSVLRADLASNAASVRLTVTDVFDQKISRVVAVDKVEPLVGVSVPDEFRSGLRYECFEAPQREQWEQIPQFDGLEVAGSGVVNLLDLSVHGQRKSQYALKYKGYLRVPETGIYVFKLISSDGSRIRIDGEIVADFDGRHGPSDRRYPITLRQGWHSFQLDYFKGKALKGGRYTALQLSWSGPGFDMRELERDQFACAADGRTPMIELPDTGAGLNVQGNLISLNPRIESRGSDLELIEYYRGKQRIARAERDDPAITRLLPAGMNRIWARLWFEGAKSVDSNIIDVDARNQTRPPWKYTVLGEKDLPLGIRYMDGEFAFTGEGVCFANQRVEGDFTLTARLDEIALRTRVNGIHPNSWLGLCVKKELDKPYSWFRGIFRTAGKGYKVAPDTRDLAGARMSTLRVNSKDRWLRLVRDGNAVRTYLAPDGEDWRQVSEKIDKSLPEQLYAGMIFRTIPYKNDTLFYGSLDNVSLDIGGAYDTEREPLPAKSLKRDNRVAAVVQAAAEPKLLFARTLGQGLLRSIDRGASWQTVDDGIASAPARFVRSVAVSPSDPSIILRGGGAMVGGKLVSGLWRSADGGVSWDLVSDKVDFDGAGPAAIFGETIAFNPEEPDMVAAAGESSGVYLSRDAGRTWKYAGLEGQRTTCLAFSPNKHRNRTYLLAGTCPDSELATLGMSAPAVRSDEPGRIYRLHFSKNSANVDVVCEADDLGVANFAFGNRINLLYAATTRGLFISWGGWGTLYQRNRGPCPGELLIAMDGNQARGDWFLAAGYACHDDTPLWLVKGQGRIWDAVAKKPKLKENHDAVDMEDGITCLLQDSKNPETVIICNRHGIFKSDDRGKTYKLVHRTTQ